MAKSFCTTVLLALSAVSVRADFTYEQTSKVTGGAMAGMMKVAGAFSKQAREPMQTTVSVKGDRLSMTSANRISIIDLGAETMTEVDLEKKTYAVITFADVSRAIQKMSEKMGEKNDASMNFKADVKQTGATRAINGFQTKESILTLTMEGQDQKTGNKGAMTIVTDMWLAPSVPGYEEVRSFYARMAQKLAWAPGMGGMGAMMGRQAGMMKGMAEISKEASKLDGVPILQVIRMGGATEGMSGADLAQAQQASADAQAGQQQQQQPAPSVGEAAGSAAAGSAVGRMGKIGGLAGGLGGFGRKKKPQQEAEQPPQQQENPPQAAPQSPSGATPPGTLMELTTELTAFSSAPVDGAKLSVPAGFKQVEHDMQKAFK
jgi:hypothetical protein